MLLRLCEKKLRQLHEVLLGNDVAATLKEMEEEEVGGVYATSKLWCVWSESPGLSIFLSFSSSKTVSRIKDSDVHLFRRKVVDFRMLRRNSISITDPTVQLLI